MIVDIEEGENEDGVEPIGEDEGNNTKQDVSNNTSNDKVEEEPFISDFYYNFEEYENLKDTRAIRRVDKKYFGKDFLKISDEDDLFSIFPKFTFDNYTYLMGDYFTMDYSQLKVYTELEIKIDFYEV